MSTATLAPMFDNVIHQVAQDDTYHSMEGWSVSQWKLDSPEEIYGYHVAEPPLWPFTVTPAMQFGHKVHARLLEPDTFSQRYPAAEPCCGILKSGKRIGEQCGSSASLRDPYGQWYCGTHAKGMASLEAVECLDSDDAQRLNHIVRAVNADPKVRWLINAPGAEEYALFGTHAETGLPVRGRLDKWIEHDGKRFIVDLKTISCDPTNERLVAKQFAALSYEMQAAAYLDMMAAHGKPCDAFFHIVVKTSPPYTSCLWCLSDEEIALGRNRNRVALRDLAERLSTGRWTGARHGEVNMLSYPKYAFGDVKPEPMEEFAAFAE